LLSAEQERYGTCSRDFAVSCVVVWNCLTADLRALSLTVNNVCQALKDINVWLLELAHLRTIMFCAVHMRSLLLLASRMGQYCFARWRLSSSSVVVCNATGVRGGRRARGRSGGRHSTAGQYCYVPLGRHLVTITIIIIIIIIIICVARHRSTPCTSFTITIANRYYYISGVCGICRFGVRLREAMRCIRASEEADGIKNVTLS